MVRWVSFVSELRLRLSMWEVRVRVTVGIAIRPRELGVEFSICS